MASEPAAEQEAGEGETTPLWLCESCQRFRVFRGEAGQQCGSCQQPMIRNPFFVEISEPSTPKGERASVLETWAFKAGYLAGRQHEYPAPEALSRWLLSRAPEQGERVEGWVTPEAIQHAQDGKMGERGFIVRLEKKVWDDSRERRATLIIHPDPQEPDDE